MAHGSREASHPLVPPPVRSACGWRAAGGVADSSGGAEPRAPWGGDGAARAPPLTRLTACPRAVCGRAYPTACPDRSAFQREIPMFSAESIILPEGLPRALSSGSAETRLYAGPMQGANWVAAGTPGVETPLPSCQRGDLRLGAMFRPVARTSVIPVDGAGAAPGGRGRETAVAPMRRRSPEGASRRLAKWNSGVR